MNSGSHSDHVPDRTRLLMSVAFLTAIYIDDSVMDTEDKSSCFTLLTVKCPSNVNVFLVLLDIDMKYRSSNRP